MEDEPIRSRIVGGDVFEGERRTGRRDGRLPLRIADARLAIGDLQHAAAGGERRGELTGSLWKRGHRVKRRQAKERQRRHQNTVDGPRRPGGGSDRQHPGDGHPRDGDAQPVRDARREPVAPGEPGDRAVDLTEPRHRRGFRAAHEELRGTAQQLDELGAERSPGGGGIGSRSSQPPADQRDDGGAGQEAGRHDERGSGQNRRRHGHRGGADRKADHRRPEAAQIDALEGVDVADHTRQEVTLPIGVQLGWGERLDAFVEADADAGQEPEGDVVRRQPLEVPSHGPAEPEEPHRDDGGGQRQDRRALGGTGD